MFQMKLNERGLARCERLIEEATLAHVAILRDETGARIVDCGVHVRGGLEAGRSLAEVCMADLANVGIAVGNSTLWPGPSVMVASDQPVAACMASQYAGWQIAGQKFFAMGSGPMRAARGREPIFESIDHRESPSAVVGVLEASKLPHDDVCHLIAGECRVDPDNLTLMVAPTASLAGTVQVVARSIETALHKMYEIGFEIDRVVSSFGVAPLPPVAADDMAAIGRTNDSVLYGGEVTLWLSGDDDSLTELGPRIPSSASPDFGQPFAEVFERHDRDFYKIDPMLFSPAVVTLNNIDTGNSFRFGTTSPEVLRRSFES